MNNMQMLQNFTLDEHIKKVHKSRTRESKAFMQWSKKLQSFIDDEHTQEINNQCRIYQATAMEQKAKKPKENEQAMREDLSCKMKKNKNVEFAKNEKFDSHKL